MPLALRLRYLGFWFVITFSCEFHMFLFLISLFKFVYYVNGLLYFLIYWRIYIMLLFIRLSRSCFLSEFIHVRCSKQFTVFHLIIMSFTLWLVPHLWLILFSFHHHSILQLTNTLWQILEILPCLPNLDYILNLKTWLLD